MSDSRAEFEAWCKENATHPMSIYGSISWAAWKAGSASMQAKAVKACENQRLNDDTGIDSDRAYDLAIIHVSDAIKDLKP